MEQTVTIWAPSGSTVNLRKHQDKGSALVDRIPIGETVILEYLGDEWSRVRYKGKIGYVMTEFLKFEENTENQPEAGAETETGSETVTIRLRRDQVETLVSLLNVVTNQSRQ